MSRQRRPARTDRGARPLVGAAWLQRQLSGLSGDVQVALGGTTLSERLGGEIIPGLLDQIQALEAVPDRAGALERTITKLKQLADTLYVLDYAAKGEPVERGTPLIFGRR